MSKRSLGRGLEALISSQNESFTGGPSSDLAQIPVDRVIPSIFQPRTKFDPERIEELAASIRTQGVVEPIIVRRLGDERYELIAGERRLRAAKLAGLTHIPAVIRDIDDRAALELSLVENLAREDLNPVDEARALARLNQEFSLSHEEIAKRIGKSRPYVTNAIRLLDLPAEVMEMLERGDLSPGQARPLLAIKSEEEQKKVASLIVAKNLSARDAESIVRNLQSPKATSRPKLKTNPELQALVENLQSVLKRRVRIVANSRRPGGKIEIEFYDDDDLNSLVEMIAQL